MKKKQTNNICICCIIIIVQFYLIWLKNMSLLLQLVLCVQINTKKKRVDWVLLNKSVQQFLHSYADKFLKQSLNS